MENQLSEEKLENIRQILRDISIEDTNQSLIMDNKLFFNDEKNSYRCVMPSQKDQSEAEDIKNTFKRNNLGKYPTKTQYKQELKEKQNVDIEKLEEERIKLKEKLKQEYLTYATILSDRPEELKKQEEILTKLKIDLIKLITEITDYLSPCLEVKADNLYHEYITYLCTEKLMLDEKEENRQKWIKVWNSFDEYENDRSLLSSKAIQRVQTLLLNVME